MPCAPPALSRPPVPRSRRTSLDCAHGEHLDTDAAPRRRAAVRAGQRLPDPPRAGLLAGRRVGPHQPGLDLLRARDAGPRGAPRAALARRGQPHGHRLHDDRGGPRRVPAAVRARRCACTTAVRPAGSRRPCRSQPLVDREVFLGLLEERLRGRRCACSRRARHWPRRRPTTCRRTCPPLIGLWQAQAATERAWLVDTDRRPSRLAAVRTRASTSGWAPPADDPGWAMQADRERYRQALGLTD